MATRKYKNIKTTNSRPYNGEYISYIENGLKNKGLNNKQISVILGNIIEESGGDPFALSEKGDFYGLLQWSKERYPNRNKYEDPYKEIDAQLNYLYDTLYNTTDKMSWTHGGEGSGYKKGIYANKEFLDDNAPLDKIHRAFSFGYVRPRDKEDSYENRLKVVKQVDSMRKYYDIIENILEPKIFDRSFDNNPNQLKYLVGPSRKKYWFGGSTITDPGSVTWGTEIKAEDIPYGEYSASGEGVVGSSVLTGVTTGLGSDVALIRTMEIPLVKINNITSASSILGYPSHQSISSSLCLTSLPHCKKERGAIFGLG